MNKRGFTLMELVVYMAMIGIVVLVAGEAFSNSTRFRVRTQNMLKSTQEAENVASIFKEDVAQMGAKSAKGSGAAEGGSSYGDNFITNMIPQLYIDASNSNDDKKDSSSFFVSSKKDSLMFRRMRYDASGLWTSVEEIAWYAKNGSLMRSCKIIAKESGFKLSDKSCADVGSSPEPVTLIEGSLDTFEVIPARPSVIRTDSIQLFPPNEATEFRLVPRFGETKFNRLKISDAASVEDEGGTEQVLYAFTSNYDDEKETVKSGDPAVNQVIAIRNESAASSDDSWKQNCQNYSGSFTFFPNREYEISFATPSRSDASEKMLNFVPGTDHLSVGFRDISSGDIPKKNGNRLIDDFLFYPPLTTSTATGAQSMRFTVADTVKNVCLAFTFVNFSPLAAQGTLTIKDLKVRQIASASYEFDESFNVENQKTAKQNVKAFKLKLSVKKKGETGTAEVIVPTPSNGPRD